LCTTAVTAALKPPNDPHRAPSDDGAETIEQGAKPANGVGGIDLKHQANPIN